MGALNNVFHVEIICLPIGRFFVKLRSVMSRRTPALHVPRRRPKQGGYARGDETRAQIINVALQAFGERGFDQASTRDIAAQAGVTPPALQYYFDSKEGLHRACAQYIIDRAQVRISPVLERAAGAAAGSPAGALEVLEVLLDTLMDNLAEPGSELWSRFIARGKHDGAGPGMEMIRAQISVPMIDAVSTLLGVISGLTPDHELTRLRAMLVLGQIHWMHSRREEVLRVMGWPQLSAARIATIKQEVREHTRRALRDIGVPVGKRAPRRTTSPG
jgi:AcrR family transcriptional regulator